MSSILKLSSPATREYWEIPVLYEDDHLLAVDKPSGLLTSPDPYDPERPSLIKLLHKGIAEAKAWAVERRLDHLMNAHRLEIETSGVLLLARSKSVLLALADLFGSEKPYQIYKALVQGEPAEERFEVTAKLAPHAFKPGMVRVDPKRGKQARSLFTVAERFGGWTLVNCEPLTARRHQIRVHLRSVGLPIVGDSLYGGKPLLLSQVKRGYRLKPGHHEKPLIDQVALHAEELKLPHPVTGKLLSITAPWPKDLTVAVKYLRRYKTPNAQCSIRNAQ